jgi:hypothetical protein
MAYPTRSGDNFAFERFRQRFSDTIRDLAGSPERSYFPETVEQDSLTGSVVYLDSVGPKDPANVNDLTATNTMRGFEASSKAFADYNSVMTPFMDTTYQRTLSTPQLIEWGHTFSEWEDLLDIIDPTNRITWAGMRSIFKARDQLFLNALSASSVSRVNGSASNEVTPVSVNFPASQKINSAQQDKFLIQDISHAQRIFEDNYVNDEQVMALISPQTKQSLIDNNDRIMDYNFVSRSRRWFEEGELPDIYGVVFLVSPLVANDKAYFYTRSGLIWNTSRGLTSSLDRVPQIRNGTQAYMRESVDCKRIDDLKVVEMTIQSSAVSGSGKTKGVTPNQEK